ncbi:MAG: N-acetylglutamate synthase [Dehalococcoidia bacterium]|nr:N-acetylglutamate synthase [Dehalococcoidia bacterium]
MVSRVTFDIERAKIGDVSDIHSLITPFAQQGEMLYRPMSELYENIRDYYVVRKDGLLIGCASLHVVWEDLAEVKAVAVAEEWQSHGLGVMLLQRCIEEAREIGIATVFCLTHKPGYYERFGFVQGDVMSLPRKVWGECLRCPKFPQCNEIAMVMHLVPGGSRSLAETEGGGRGFWSDPTESQIPIRPTF